VRFHLPRRPTPAIIISLLALFASLGGSAYAIGSSQINGKLLKNRSVAGIKLMKHTITGTDVNLGKLGKVPSAQHADTATNATNAADSNELGGSPPSAYQLQLAIGMSQGTPPVSITNGSDGTAIANCADTQNAIAGGFRWTTITPGLVIYVSGPSVRGDGSIGGWRVDGHNGTGATDSLVPFVLCINK
jgi:hypothetical protein